MGPATVKKSKAAVATTAAATAAADEFELPEPVAVPTQPASDDLNFNVYSALWGTVIVYAAYMACQTAYRIRLGAINEYGPVIHEFDPYFNYRATEYLYWNGAQRFFQWFDFTVWYPLGRPVGTTIYPGMQFTAVWLKRHVIQERMSLNDICCYIPAWFGVCATIVTGLIAYECTIPVNAHHNLYTYLTERHPALFGTTATSPSRPTTNGWSPALECTVMAMFMMAIVPAHLMRSMGGGYDNESVAVTAMVTTFYCWTRSLRSTNSLLTTILWSLGTGLAYFYMVAAWGGYVFVLNLIGVHAAVLVGLGRWSNRVYVAYTLFYIVGTSLAVHVPVVGWAPLKSLEQLGPCAVFLAYQLILPTELWIRAQRAKNASAWNFKQAWTVRVQIFGAAAVVAILAAMVVMPAGYFGPISSRVRGLFVQHTKTGNPLVDSVAEHQPASSRAYFQYLHHVCSLAPIGYLLVGVWHVSDASLFLLVWGTAAYFFSHKMVRLILLTAPIACILGGMAAGRVLAWCIAQWWDSKLATEGTNGTSDVKKKKKVVPKKTSSKSSFEGFDALQTAVEAFGKTKTGVTAKRTASVLLIVTGLLIGQTFVVYCWRLSHDLSNPTIIQKARKPDGEIILLDDYREAYWWLRDNTPEDSRIMAWWDYGYQISAIANRTTLADGNTWNHEHIALLGKALTTDLEEGWEIARHLADYVLIWGGGGGDDLAKSPHLARIANSVYRDHCPDDPTCRAFGFIDRQGTPSAMMRRSLLFNLHGRGLRPDVVVSEDRFVEVFRSMYGKVRIYQISGVSEESKQWVLDHRQCDVKGSWFCPGKYPPGLKPFLDSKTDFRQLEDFNKKGADEEYQKNYFKDLQNPEIARKKVMEKEYRELKNKESSSGDASEDDLTRQKQHMYKNWEDSEGATQMWNLINNNDVQGLTEWLETEPHMAFIRSKDGRGPMFWAFEKRNDEITRLLMKAGVPHTDKDAKGLTPADLLGGAN